MKKYILKSKGFEGSVFFGFNDAGSMIYYSNESNMDVTQINWISNHFPFSEGYLKELKKKITGKLELVPVDTSFDAFWEKYDKKINRKRCEPEWKKISDSKRILCLMSIDPYVSFLKRTSGRAKKDPENYLKDEMYLNEWGKLTT